jgi:hypothetical protein
VIPISWGRKHFGGCWLTHEEFNALMGKKGKQDEAEWWRKNFPTVEARAAADKAIDALDAKEPMTRFIDTWIAAYLAAGGKTSIKP